MAAALLTQLGFALHETGGPANGLVVTSAPLSEGSCRENLGVEVKMLGRKPRSGVLVTGLGTLLAGCG